MTAITQGSWPQQQSVLMLYKFTYTNPYTNPSEDRDTYLPATIVYIKTEDVL